MRATFLLIAAPLAWAACRPAGELLGLYRDNKKEHGNCKDYIAMKQPHKWLAGNNFGNVMGLYRDDGRENGNCSIRGYILGSSRG